MTDKSAAAMRAALEVCRTRVGEALEVRFSYTAQNDLEMIKAALTTDAGRGWVRPEVGAQMAAALRTVDLPLDINDWDNDCYEIQAALEAYEKEGSNDRQIL